MGPQVFNTLRHLLLILTFLLANGSALGASAQATTRIKDLVNLRGVRSNQLVGFGLVIGLQGTGDSAKSLATNSAINSMLSKLGFKKDGGGYANQNMAAVILTAELPPFARIGDKIDVKVSTVGDAKSLAGGTLIMAPLRAGDSQVYAVGQGSLVTGQANGSGTRVLTVGLVPSGALVEREFTPAFEQERKLSLSLRQQDFTTSARIAEAINEHFRGYFAKASNSGLIEVEVPSLYFSQVVEFIAELEALTVAVDQKAKVVLNERTGTVVMGSDVMVDRVAISHGDLNIKVGGKDGKGAKSVVGLDGVTIGDLVETMNSMGMKPADLIGVLQALHAAGAIHAELQIM